MGMLAGVNYDPATAVSKSTAAALALTAMDLTNLRVTFTVPANGAVLVRCAGVLHGAITYPQVLLGVLQGSTVIGRAAPMLGGAGAAPAATTRGRAECAFIVTGLTPGASLTWDAAYGVETLVTSTGLKYGGPNTTADDAFGGYAFEVWDAPHLLAGKNYDPATAVVNKAVSAVLAMTAFDTTNLRLTFSAPSSGKVLVRQGCVIHGATAQPQILLGVMNGATVVGRQAAMLSGGNLAATTLQKAEAAYIVSGLTPGASTTWDAAYGVEVIAASGNIKYGGPNNATANDAFGGFAYEIYSLDA
jgi:hypothetical protein